MFYLSDLFEGRFYMNYFDFMVGSKAAWADNEIPLPTRISETNGIGKNQESYNAGQANNVYQGVVHSWEKITDWVKDKISDSEESKKQK
jgi:hypothetical protein